MAEALVLSVLKEYDSDEKDEKYFTLLYKMYNFCITFFTAGVILGTKILAKILFANDFYSTLSQALGWTIVRMLAIIIIVIIPPIIKRQKEKKLQQIKDEADRKEQERRESMGKWK